MTTMLEKAARAAEEADMDWAFNPDGDRFEQVARAVLLAIREPDATVTSAMGKESYPDSGSYTRWQAGIDSILAEETGT